MSVGGAMDINIKCTCISIPHSESIKKSNSLEKNWPFGDPNQCPLCLRADALPNVLDDFQSCERLFSYIYLTLPFRINGYNGCSI
jgi:hypothetical protein